MSSFLGALGWSLIHFCWEAAAIAAMTFVSDRLIARNSAQARYLLMLAALLSMLCVAVGTFFYELSSATLNTPVAGYANSIPWAMDMSTRMNTLLPWIDGAWWVGLSVCSMRSAGEWWALRRLRGFTFLVQSAEIQSAFERVCHRIGLSKIPRLASSDHVDNPMTFGLFRSIVLVPTSALFSLTPDQLETVLAHELAHIRRADYFWNIVQLTLESLFFFHPAVWWLGRKLREQRELCCDDIVVSLCADPLVYATALFRLEEERVQRVGLAMALNGACPSQFRQRILRLLGEHYPLESSRPFHSLLLLSVSALVLLCLVPARQVLGVSQVTRPGSLAPTSAPLFSTTLAASPRSYRPSRKLERRSASTGSETRSRKAATRLIQPEQNPSPHLVLDLTSDEPPPHLTLGQLGSVPSPHIRAGSADIHPPPHI